MGSPPAQDLPMQPPQGLEHHSPKGRRARSANAPNRGGLHPLHGDVNCPPTCFRPSLARSLRGRGTPGRDMDVHVVNDNALHPDNEARNVGLHIRLRTSLQPPPPKEAAKADCN